MALAIALLIQSMMSLAAFAPVLVAPPILLKLGISAQWIGAYVPVAFTGAIIGSGLSGRLLGRFGPWQISLICMTITGIGMAVFGLATPVSAALSTFIIGLSYGPIAAAGSSILVQDGTQNLSLRMSIRQSGVPLGISVGAFALPRLCHTFDWRLVWEWLAAGFVISAAIFGCWIYITDLGAQARQPRPAFHGLRIQPLRFARAHAELRPLAFLCFIYASVQTCFSSFLSVYLVEFLHLDLRQAGMLVGTGSALGMAARVVWGLIADRWGTLNVLVLIGIAISASSVLTGCLSANTPFGLIAASIALFGSAATGWNGVLFAHTAHLAPQDQVGGVTGEMAAFAYIGFILAAPIFSSISAGASIADAYVTTGLAAGASVAIFIYFSLRKARAEKRGEAI